MVTDIDKNESDIIRICWSIASQVIIDGFNYDAAKMNVLAQYAQERTNAEKTIALAAQSLNMDGSKKEIEALAKMLVELRKEYGNKITIPHL